MTSSNFLIGAALLLVGSHLKGAFSIATSLSSLNQVKRTELKEFGTMVNKLNLPQNFMKDEAYQLRYLSSNDFNVNSTFQRFQQVLELRKAENVDHVLEENWTEFERKYPVSLSSVTRDGSPILYVPNGAWSFTVAEEATKEYARYFAIKITEEADRKAQAMRRRFKRDVSQFIVILDFKDHVEEDACLSCLQNVYKTAESLYSEAIDEVYVINTPSHLQAIFASLNGVLVEKSRDRVHVLGGWESFEPVLLQRIDLKDFPKEIAKQ